MSTPTTKPADRQTGCNCLAAFYSGILAGGGLAGAAMALFNGMPLAAWLIAAAGLTLAAMVQALAGESAPPGDKPSED